MEKLEELEEVKEGVLEEPIVEEIENDEQEIKVTP